jgi:hypothetical protein
MVHRSMKDNSRVADILYIKRGLLALEGFIFLLSLLVLLYSQVSYDFETASTLVLSCLAFIPSKRTLSLLPCFPITKS